MLLLDAVQTFFDLGELLVLGIDDSVVVGDLEKRLHFGEQPPPLPVAQFQPGETVPLKNTNSVGLLHSLHVQTSSKRRTAFCLELHNETSQLQIS